MNDFANETMIESHITYTLRIEDRFYVIENVPARICVETGEEFFSLDTMERLQQKFGKINNPSELSKLPYLTSPPENL